VTYTPSLNSVLQVVIVSLGHYVTPFFITFKLKLQVYS
jgi:hypothetical protein